MSWKGERVLGLTCLDQILPQGVLEMAGFHRELREGGLGLTCFVSNFGTGHSMRGGSRLRIDGGAGNWDNTEGSAY